MNGTRRNFILAAGGGALAGHSCGSGGGVTRSASIEHVEHSYADYTYRTPMKFGGHTVDRVTLLNVECHLRSSDGRVVKGIGSMSMGNNWAFPSQEMSYETTLNAMKGLAAKTTAIMNGYGEAGHPIDIGVAVEAECLQTASEVSAEQELLTAIPKLCTLVTLSPFDAALHDAYGKLHGLSTYQTYSGEFMTRDLAAFLTPEFAGEYLDQYISGEPRPTMSVYHTVGAGDPLTAAELDMRIGDGLPETLEEWIATDGLTHFKIKLDSTDLENDINRVIDIDTVVSASVPGEKFYLCDFNEQCPNVEYLIEFLREIEQRRPTAFGRIQYIEQPTARDLRADRDNVMHEASKLRPVVIDESLVDLEHLMLAREMGYTGVALKACKGQTQAMLMAAAARKYGMFLCVQDLTCPGLALIESAGIAAHVPGVTGMEANGRQYVPSANAGWADRYPGLFEVREGVIHTGQLNGPGLSGVELERSEG